MNALIFMSLAFYLAVPAVRAAEIHEAARSGDLAKVRSIIEKEPGLAGVRDETGRTPLHWACRGVHIEVVKYLVEHGADVDARDNAGVTPLHSVASRGHLEAAKTLIGAGARLEAKMSDGSTPLHLAAAQGHKELAALLFEKNAPIGIQDGREDTPLHAAAWVDRWEVVDLIAGRLSTGHKNALNLRDFDGNTILHLAARAGRLEIMKLLVSKGADAAARNALGQTAFNLVETGGFGDAAAFLARAGADQRPSRFPVFSGPYLGQTLPGAAPKLFAKGIVSTRAGMYGTITFSPDGREAFWKPEGTHMLSMTMEGGVWSAPRAIPNPEDGAFDTPFFSIDGKKLYVTRGTRGSSGRIEIETIWYFEKNGPAWSEPKHFDPVIDSGGMHWQFAMDKTGDVYLSGKGGIHRARFENGKFLAPEPLPAPINVQHTEEEKYRAGEVGPFVSPEGDYLIYSKFRAGAPLPCQLFISFKGQDGRWSEPRNLSEKLMTEGNDSMARVSPDGKYLFFQSERRGSGASRGLYWVDAGIIETLRPKGR